MKIEKSKVLITGGFGALGLNLIEELQNKFDCKIMVVDNFSAGTSNHDIKIDFTYLDISNSEKTQSFFEKYKPNFIFHLAAHFANQNSVDHPISDIQTNVIGLVNLFESQKKNSELKKIIFASSSCVYGNSNIMNENDNISPYDTPYAINKYVGELYCNYYAKIHNIPTISARIFNSFGPGEMPGAYRNVIPNFIKKAMQNEEITITGTGDETRDFTYVSNTIDLLIKLAESDYISAEVFNAGTGSKTKIKYLAETIVRLTNSKSKIVYKEARNWDHVKDRLSDISKSKRLLNYQPEYDFEQGLLQTINWIKSKI
jgi:UDP-glucose 4-epimerase